SDAAAEKGKGRRPLMLPSDNDIDHLLDLDAGGGACWQSGQKELCPVWRDVLQPANSGDPAFPVHKSKSPDVRSRQERLRKYPFAQVRTAQKFVVSVELLSCCQRLENQLGQFNRSVWGVHSIVLGYHSLEQVEHSSRVNRVPPTKRLSLIL